MVTGEDYIHRAYNAILQKDYRLAVYYFKKAIQSDPDNASYRYKLSITHARNNDLAEALKEAEAACYLNPDVPLYRQHLDSMKSRYLTQKAHDAMEKGEETTAIESLLQQAISLNPLNTDAKLLLSDVYEKQGELTKAQKQLYEIIELQPHHQIARKHLSQINKRLT
ncbi:MAG: tetratricopeptide repeat protein [Bacillaceae bacterium]|nr:tetratricopeptide repeat protein [Bacillaceae bacterium]